MTDKHNTPCKTGIFDRATAAPRLYHCPVSSWAAAVTGFVEGEDGFSIFIQAIPYNFYALLTIVMMIGMVALKCEFGPMKVHEDNAKKGIFIQQKVAHMPILQKK